MYVLTTDCKIKNREYVGLKCAHSVTRATFSKNKWHIFILNLQG